MIELNPNCSEATMRLNITDLPENVVKKIVKAIEQVKNENDGDEGGNGWWYDTWYSIDYIFNTRVITISGDAPYNHYDELVEELGKKLDVVTICDKKKSAAFNTRVEILTNGNKKVNNVRKTEIDLKNLLEDIEWTQ